MRSEPRTGGVVEIPITDEWMDAALPKYEDGRTLLEPEFLDGIEERAEAKTRLEHTVATELAKLRAKIARAGRPR